MHHTHLAYTLPTPCARPPQVVCQLLTVAASSSSRVPRSIDPVKFFCNSSATDDGEADSVVLEKVKRDRQLYLFLTICYSLLLAVLACTIAYTALQLRFVILKAKYYHREPSCGLTLPIPLALALTLTPTPTPTRPRLARPAEDVFARHDHQRQPAPPL